MQAFDKVEGEYHQEHEQFMSNTRMIQDMTKAINVSEARCRSDHQSHGAHEDDEVVFTGQQEEAEAADVMPVREELDDSRNC
ncbi:hypothetical protein GE061_015699 [Apolygus lucorum]|uniref:Uncharacterized protein n=1 Tax=Apolygus lucorum TaxID=248454 RepID=A0A6A4J8E8_APOLU|nr:hypothetical protein GE061_015699 [Apolygus lucorum]